MAVITVRITTHDRSRCAEITLPDSLTAGTVISECRRRWQLDHSEIFALRDLGRNLRLDEDDSLSTAGVFSGANLQIFPLVEGG